MIIYKPVIGHPNGATLLFGATSILGVNFAKTFRKSILPFVTPGNHLEAIRQWPALGLENADWPPAAFKQHVSTVAEPSSTILFLAQKINDRPVLRQRRGHLFAAEPTSDG